MTTHFKDHKEKITCTGGSLDGRELWIAVGLGKFHGARAQRGAGDICARCRDDLVQVSGGAENGGNAVQPVIL